MKNLVLATALFASSFMSTQAQTIVQTPPAIHVSGESSVSIVPDYAVISLGAEIKNKNAETAKKESDQIINKTLQTLKKYKIEDKNIQTQRVNLYKQHDYETKTDHFIANQIVTINLYQLDKYDALMNELIANGVNAIQGVEFKSSKTANYESEIRQKAVLDAKKKATDYASALNQTIGKALSISDQSTNIVAPRLYEMKMADATMNTTLAEGEIKITCNVQVSFELK